MTTTFGGSYSLDDLRTHAVHTSDAADVSIPGDEVKASAYFAAGAALGDLIKEIERLKRFEPEPVSLSSSEELENLFTDFSSALLMRARAAQELDGFTDDWKNNDWQDQLNLQIAHHVANGDPRDSALYCAFAWYHGWEIQIPGFDALSPPSQSTSNPVQTTVAKLPTVDTSASYETLERKVLAWTSTGEAGLSSLCIAYTSIGIECDTDHPLDLDDFQRCLLLLDAVPELRPRLKSMTTVSPHWLALTERWDELEAKAIAELGWSFGRGFSKPINTAKLSHRALKECLTKGDELQASMNTEIDQALCQYDQTN